MIKKGLSTKFLLPLPTMWHWQLCLCNPPVCVSSPGHQHSTVPESGSLFLCKKRYLQPHCSLAWTKTKKTRNSPQQRPRPKDKVTHHTRGCKNLVSLEGVASHPESVELPPSPSSCIKTAKKNHHVCRMKRKQIDVRKMLARPKRTVFFECFVIRNI